MALKSHRDAANQHHGIAFHDDTRNMAADRATAQIALARHLDTVHRHRTGSGDYLAAMTGDVAESNHIFHAVLPQLHQVASGLRLLAYRSAIQRHTVMP